MFGQTICGEPYTGPHIDTDPKAKDGSRLCMEGYTWSPPTESCMKLTSGDGAYKQKGEDRDPNQYNPYDPKDNSLQRDLDDENAEKLMGQPPTEGGSSDKSPPVTWKGMPEAKEKAEDGEKTGGQGSPEGQNILEGGEEPEDQGKPKDNETPKGADKPPPKEKPEGKVRI
jgi:hypothetical protein